MLFLFIFGDEQIWAKPEAIDLHTPIMYDSNQRIRTSTIKFIVDEAINSILKKGDSLFISEKRISDKAYYKTKKELVEIKW